MEILGGETHLSANTTQVEHTVASSGGIDGEAGEGEDDEGGEDGEECVHGESESRLVAGWVECDRAGIVMVTGTVKSLGLVSHNPSTNLLETIKGKPFPRYSSGIESTVHYSAPLGFNTVH